MLAGAEPDREIVQQALQRLLQWPEIARSPQLGKFLDYIVRSRLDGDEQSIKAYSIAVDVFGRGEDFDPQSDPIVRVQARRLRSLIDDYYNGPGAGDPLQIRLPVGRYIPEFVERPALEATQRVEPASAPPPVVPYEITPPNRRSPYLLAGAALVAVLGVAALVFLSPRQQGTAPQAGLLDRPSVSVVEFQNLAAGAARAPQVAGLAIELVTDLEQFDNLRVSYRSGGEVSEGADAAPIDDFVLTGIVRQQAEEVQYSAILTESVTGAVVWDRTLAIPAAEAATPPVLDRVSKSFSLVLGSPRGPLHVAARAVIAAAGPVSPTNLYLCGEAFDLYRETGLPSDAQKSDNCFASLSETEKQGPIALAAGASLLVEYAGSTAGAEMPLADRIRMAQTQLSRALNQDPINSFIWEQQARLHEAQGALPQASADYASAVQLNPANTDALAAFGLLLALSGGLEQSEEMARDAAERSPNPPAWYFAVPTLLDLRDGNFSTAVGHAERYAQADRELGPVLAIMAGQAAGQSDLVNRYLPEVLEVASFRAKGVLPRLRERISDDSLIESIRGSLTEAGVPWNALVRSF